MNAVNSEFLYLIPIKIQPYYVSTNKWKEALDIIVEPSCVRAI